MNGIIEEAIWRISKKGNNLNETSNKNCQLCLNITLNNSGTLTKSENKDASLFFLTHFKGLFSFLENFQLATNTFPIAYEDKATIFNAS